VGVQWHPEIEGSPQDDMSGLFRALMAASR